MIAEHLNKLFLLGSIFISSLFYGLNPVIRSAKIERSDFLHCNFQKIQWGAKKRSVALRSIFALRNYGSDVHSFHSLLEKFKESAF